MTSPTQPLDCREKQEALDRVLQSQVFARADLLRKFLSYVCSIEMAGRGDEITEYSIGVDALGRPNNFSPTEDSTVRGRARDMRIKLDQFYESEGSDAIIRISFHKGSYVPTYVKSNTGGQRAEALRLKFPKPVPARTRTWALPVICALIGAALAGAAFFTFVPARRTDPVVREFWGPLLRPDGNVLVVLGTPLSVTFRHLDLPPEVARSKPAPPEVEEWLK
ncbi:MAG: hypothetical protein NTW28_21905, partial [Candidatus Solibacter sp.]|nr:hypothetical protein [Candidatus Solibacter sp.]